jgi:D-glycero-D-manno-heptose 1,7-bisphosphate phosphatase
MALRKRPAVFFDKDGTLIKNVPYNVDPFRMSFLAGAREAVSLLKEEFTFHVVSNQPGVALGYFDERKLLPVKWCLEDFFRSSGAKLEEFHYCPHHPHGVVEEYALSCDCRKPGPRMILEAADRFQLDLENSWMVGDILDDIEAGKRAGCRTILIDNGNETEWTLNENRVPDFIVHGLMDAARIIQKESEVG